MKKLTVFSILFILFIPYFSTYSQTYNINNYFALGFEGCLPGPYDPVPPFDSLAEFKCIIHHC